MFRYSALAASLSAFSAMFLLLERRRWPPITVGSKRHVTIVTHLKHDLNRARVFCLASWLLDIIFGGWDLTRGAASKNKLNSLLASTTVQQRKGAIFKWGGGGKTRLHDRGR